LLQAAEGFDPEYLAQIEWAPDRRSVRISAQGARDFFYSSCPVELVDQVIPQLTAEPIAPYEAPIVTTEAGLVECLAITLKPPGTA
jgi:hypothetical protein